MPDHTPDTLSQAVAAVAGGRLRAARRTGGTASLVLDATGLSQRDGAALEGRARTAALGVDGIEEARVAMTTERSGRPLIAVASGKGGVGKSTLTANLAVALARAGRTVGVLDADIYGPSQPTLFGSAGVKAEAADDRLVPLAASHGVRHLSIGHLVDPDKALAWRGPMATGALTQLVDAHWEGCDLILADLPPGTGDIQLSLAQKARPAGAVIVSTPQDLALIDAARAVALFRQLGVPIIGLVENMSGYLCPHCGEASAPFGHGGARAEAERLGIPMLGTVPLSLTIRELSDAGTPPAGGEGPEADAYAAIASTILDWETTNAAHR